jgi:hypothetical protein
MIGFRCFAQRPTIEKGDQYTEKHHIPSSSRRHTTSACCVLEQNDETPRGWGKGVCNTPLHFITEYTDIV